MVGATRFELVTFCTPSKRATSLRYAPTGFQQAGMVYHAFPSASMPRADYFRGFRAGPVPGGNHAARYVS